MRRPILLLWALAACSDEAPTPCQGPTCALGFEQLDALEGLAEHRGLVEAYQLSSYDRGGGNLDLGLTAPGNSVLYLDGAGRHVLFDQRGPGILNRIWATHLGVLQALESGAPLDIWSGDIHFTFDDEPTPRIALPIAALFGGQSAPFVEPFVGNPDTSSGGYVSYVPLSFAKRLVVSTSEHVHYVHLGAYRVRGPVESFDPAQLDAARVARAQEAWRSLEPVSAAGEPETHALEVPAGGSARASLAGGPAVLRGAIFSVTPAPGFMPEMRLRVVVDGVTSVDVPWGDFFLVPLEQVRAEARLVGRHEDGRYYVLFPMPYETSLEIEVQSDADTSVEISALREPTDVSGMLRFHAVHREQALVPEDSDYRALSVEGRGQLVGMQMTLCCRGASGSCGYLGGDSWGHLEGDEKVFLDGASEPQIHGTGAEDYFNSGFYYLMGRAYQRPSHGMPYQHEGALAPDGTALPHEAFDCTTQYRLHLSDPWPFESALTFDLEHGPESDMPAWFRSVAYYYLER